MSIENIDKINQLIQKGEIKKALTQLYPYINNNNILKNIYYQTHRQIEDTNNDYQKGIITYEVFSLNRNKQTESILYLIGLIENPQIHIPYQ